MRYIIDTHIYIWYAKEQALAKVDHAFGQLRQMKDGRLQGINAEELLNEL